MGDSCTFSFRDEKPRVSYVPAEITVKSAVDFLAQGIDGDNLPQILGGLNREQCVLLNDSLVQLTHCLSERMAKLPSVERVK
jgi:hypothetical protein